MFKNQCSECNKSFPMEINLNQHMTIDHGATPNRCFVCNMPFTEAKSLKNHIGLYHQGEKPMSQMYQFILIVPWPRATFKRSQHRKTVRLFRMHPIVFKVWAPKRAYQSSFFLRVNKPNRLHYTYCILHHRQHGTGESTHSVVPSAFSCVCLLYLHFNVLLLQSSSTLRLAHSAVIPSIFLYTLPVSFVQIIIWVTCFSNISFS